MNNQQQAREIAKSVWRLSRELDRKEVDALLDRLLDFLCKKNKFGLVEQILKELQKISYAADGQVLTELWSRYPLTEHEEAGIKSQIRRLTGRQAVIKRVATDDILGGLLIKFDEQVLDLTIKHQLESLKKVLSE